MSARHYPAPQIGTGAERYLNEYSRHAKEILTGTPKAPRRAAGMVLICLERYVHRDAWLSLLELETLKMREGELQLWIGNGIDEVIDEGAC